MPRFVLGLLLTGCGLASVSSARADSSRLRAIDAARFYVTAGRAQAHGPQELATDDPGMRGVVADGRARAAELTFRYLGPSRETARLANGELRRQIGLALRAQDTCNVVYVMWHIEPTQGVAVSVKRNRGLATHAQCAASGYANLAPTHAVPLPPIRVGERHALFAAFVGDRLRVTADGVLAWEGALPSSAFAFDGPVGVRSDNGVFVFEISIPDLSQ